MLFHESLNLKTFGIHVIALNETKLDPEYSKELTMITGYQQERRERTSGGGGVSIYVRGSIKYTRRCDLPDNQLELICIEIEPPKCRPFLVVAWYRPPNEPVSSFGKFEQILSFLDREGKEMALLGDTNCDLSQHVIGQPVNNDTRRMCNLYELFCFKQLIKEPTMMTLNNSTIIGHIATKAASNIVQSGVFETSRSDHFMVYCVPKYCGAQERDHKVIKTSSMK